MNSSLKLLLKKLCFDQSASSDCILWCTPSLIIQYSDSILWCYAPVILTFQLDGATHSIL